MSDLRESLTQSGTLYGFINTIVYAHDYNDLTNKPQINGVTLQGNKTASELGLVTPATEAVQSVNGETGAVVLDGNDIDYDSTKTINQQIDAVAASIPVMAVTSVNGETGDVVLDGSDIRYDSDYTVNAKIDAVAADIPVVPVQSVNGETGNVVLDGDDIAYNSSLSVNQKIDAVEAAIPVVNYPVTSVNEKTGAVVLDDTDIEHSSGVSVNSIINTITQYTPVYGNTASGAIATFDTSLALPLQDCTIAINAVQESGTPTPSSPKAISGFTGANISLGDTTNKVSGSIASASISASGQIVSNSSYTMWYAPITQGKSYILTSSETSLIYGLFTSIPDMGSTAYDTTRMVSSNFTLIAPIDGYIAFRSSSTFTTATATENNVTPITWQSEAGTVYGGSLDVTTGVLTVIWHAIDLGTLTWTYDAESVPSNPYFFCQRDTVKVSTLNLLCSIYQLANVGVSNMPNYSMKSNNKGQVLIVNHDYSDKDTFTAAMSGVLIVCEKLTPVTYQLTPTQISAIVGTNNVFTDTNGNTSVVYVCSLKDYIDSQ